MSKIYKDKKGLIILFIIFFAGIGLMYFTTISPEFLSIILFFLCIMIFWKILDFWDPMKYVDRVKSNKSDP